jgi:hypothetical protein
MNLNESLLFIESVLVFTLLNLVALREVVIVSIARQGGALILE